MASCLICNAPPAETLEEVKVDKVWGRETEMMFALQQVLLVPNSLLAKCLAETATGNVGLLTLCPPCRQLVGECREVDEQLQKLKRRWIKCSARVVAKVKAATAEVEKHESTEVGPMTKAEDLRQETRRFVINHAYPFEELKRALDNQTEEPEAGPGQRNTGADPPTNEENVLIDEGEFEVPQDAVREAALSLEEGILQPMINPNPEVNAALGNAGADASAEVPEADIAEGIIEEAKDYTKETDATPAPGMKIGRRTPVNTPTHECLFCSKTFHGEAHLASHMRVHTKERPFWCDVCGQEYTERRSLKQHQLAHAGIKPHECQICDKRFSTLYSLKLHLRWHCGEKPFDCPVCGKGFVSKANLNRHCVIHTGEKPYNCPFCPETFSHTSALYHHKKRKHVNK